MITRMECGSSKAGSLLVCGLTLLAASCGGGRLEEPYASILPSCSATVYAVELEKESQRGDARWERGCGGDESNVSLTLVKYSTQQAARDDFLVDFPSPDVDVLGSSFPMDEPVLPGADEAAEAGVIQLKPPGRPGLRRNEGLHEVWLRFRVRTYVGTFVSSAKGPVDWYFKVVVADPHSDVIEELAQETVTRLAAEP